MSNRVRETLPARVTREQLPELRKSPHYFETAHARYMIVEENGERRVCRLTVDGERDYESTAPPPNVTVDDATGDIATPLDGPYVEPSPQSIAEVELLLSVAEAEAYLDQRMLNWRGIPATPPSMMAGGRLAYSQADLDGWIAHWRNAFVTVDDITFGADGEVMMPLRFL